jgi:hypothetical protein
MMRKTLIALVGCFFLSLLGSASVRAQDGFFGDAQAIEYNRFAVGIQPIVYTEPGSEFMMMFRAGYGIQPELSFEAKVGVFREEFYIGGHMKYRVLSELEYPVTIAVIGGAYRFEDIGFKFSGEISRNFGEFSLYSGLTIEPIFTVPAQVPVLIPAGVEIPVSQQTDFIFEADLAVNEVATDYQALHFGLSFRL